MTTAIFAVAAICMLTATKCPAQQTDLSKAAVEEKVESIESNFLTGTRQLTFEGKRAGEGYFSQSGQKMVFQSERLEANPFFQIYVLDFETGDVSPISPGHGKTTCAWIAPDDETVLYASTQDDPEAIAKQKAEIEMRESGTQRRYSWDYDENYELYSGKAGSDMFVKLTEAKGYDAEGSYSPDGKQIAFASNRNAYSKPLTEEQKKKFEQDPAYMMELFIMNADGTNVRQLTDFPGYDGGPFFSPDGQRICWRRFAENGATAEVMTMKIDGTDQKTLTRMNVLSWAPYYHPSGDYLIFTTNKHGFANFELYLVAADGKSPPVRVTDTEAFDGLASFSPDGKRLTWTSNRNAQKQSQIFIADWNDANARKVLGLDGDAEAIKEAGKIGEQSAKGSSAAFRDSDIARHVQFLCREELGGRMTGSKGERMASAYVAAYFDYLGLKPAGDDGTWFQSFDFPDGAILEKGNELSVTANEATAEKIVDQDWRPLSFSGSTSVDPAEVVFAGYGIVAGKTDKFEAYDSYEGLDLNGKWAMVFRFVPEDVSAELRQHLSFLGGLRKKLLYARERGAVGLIVVSGPSSNVNEQLIPLFNDFSASGSSIAAVSVTDELASQLLPGKNLAELQKAFDDGSKQPGFAIDGIKLSAKTRVKNVTGRGQNVLGRLVVGDAPSEKVIVVGAHIDHLGIGESEGSLAREGEKSKIHVGADDNASGIAGMLEIAEYVAKLKKDGKTALKHDIVFAGWSGEELGLYGSKHFAKTWPGMITDAMEKSKPRTPDSFHDFIVGMAADGSLSLNGSPTNLETLEKEIRVVVKLAPDFPVELEVNAKAAKADSDRVVEKLKSFGLTKLKIKEGIGAVIDPTADRSIVAALNMDMIGRLEDKLVLQGIGSSTAWNRLIETSNAVVGLPLTLNDDTELPTDATSFYKAGVPILSAFTGSHKDYHTPRDTPEKLNYPEAARIAKLMGLVTRKLSISETQPVWKRQVPKEKMAMRGGGRAYLGTVPDYGTEVVGVMLDDVKSGGPSEQAGVRGGDIIVELAGTKIENIYDYTAVIDRLKPGQVVKIRVMRDKETVELDLTPGSRQ